ncbi:ABC transporter ATP-binding protein [Petroclostridium sp. X23]|uniref:ABC transporter ATP-binding protein n=1 Tax=Petroclostridium sp. X23 TaxID=3045146 RepID=UPI0024AD5ECA|nr:ABC transporter ATP-binding protein [Petroclostridium sp. X23]WHH60822.1 ABC transporter ATP-binding protein [Petroclostridium sp. X23]
MENRYKLSVKNISKTFYMQKQEVSAVEDISMDVRENEFLVLLGPGQCGKTVFLSILAGLMQPTSGEVFLDGKSHAGTDDRISMVFQKIALMPWKTVMQNVEMGPKFAGIKKEIRRKRAQHFIDLVGLKGFENSYPRHLSGGMKQRVGIARAYTNNPEILLMDEPFGQLDAQTRYAMQDEILRVWEQDKRTVVFVTNNIEEAVYLGDRIILFSERPARVKDIYSLEHLKRPRNNMDKEFLEMRELIANNTDLALA